MQSINRLTQAVNQLTLALARQAQINTKIESNALKKDTQVEFSRQIAEQNKIIDGLLVTLNIVLDAQRLSILPKGKI